MAANGLELLDAGAALYRRSFRAEIWRYYVASAPFAAILIWTWQVASATRVAHLAAPALALTLGYAVRILGTGAYGRALLATLGHERRRRGAADAAQELWTQSVLLLLWLVTLPALFGAGLWYAAAQFAPLERAGGLRAAVRMALGEWSGSLILQGLAVVMGLLTLANVGVGALMAPSLLHGLFGLGGLFGMEAGTETLLSSSTFWVALLLATYLALDPLMKCALVVSFHRRQAARTGADLEARVKQLGQRRGYTLGGAMALGAMVLVGGATARPLAAQAAPAVHVASLRHAIEAELREPVYAWHGDRSPSSFQWLAHGVDVAFRPFLRLGRWIGHLMERIWRWIDQVLFGPVHQPLASGRPGRAWQRVGWILALACLMLALGAVKLRQRKSPAESPVAPARELDIATASAGDQEEGEWFALAERLRREGELRLALRASFLGSLAGLGRRRLVTLRRDRTNREYHQELARMDTPQDDAPSRAATFGSMIRRFDEVWYGGGAVTEESLAEFMAMQPGLLRAATEAGGDGT